MRIDTDFHAAYQKLEERMNARAQDDGHAFLPNVEPEGPAHYVLIAMEPSLGGWAGSQSEARLRVKDGFRNFLPSDDVSILHFCIRRYLCGQEERYHITDLSKGAMPVARARLGRVERGDRWYGLLQEEIKLLATRNARFVAVGEKVERYLKRKTFGDITRVIHYSPLAALARSRGIIGHEESFNEFSGSLSMGDLEATAEKVLEVARVPDKIRDEALSQLRNSELTLSRRKLIFNYKLAFEKMRALRA